MASAAGQPSPHAWAFPFIAGGTAALAEISVMQPMDVLKTRFQLRSAGVTAGAADSASMLGTIRHMVAVEGASSLYKGMVPATLTIVPRRALKFGIYGGFKKLLWRGEPKAIPSSLNMLAGGLAGAVEAVLITPFEVVKVALQADRAARAEQRASMLEYARTVVRTQGAAGLYRGVQATVGKHFAHSCMYFWSYHEAQRVLPRAQTRRWDTARTLTAGFVAGTSASVVNNPLDVAKSRMQITSVAAKSDVGRELAAHYQRGLAHALRHIVQTDGWRGLYAGFGAKVARLGPGSAIIFLVYERTTEWLGGVVSL